MATTIHWTEIDATEKDLAEKGVTYFVDHDDCSEWLFWSSFDDWIGDNLPFDPNKGVSEVWLYVPDEKPPLLESQIEDLAERLLEAALEGPLEELPECIYDDLWKHASGGEVSKKLAAVIGPILTEWAVSAGRPYKPTVCVQLDKEFWTKQLAEEENK